ncbi:MAG: class I SAM-dependent RNA methyltransferase [Elusimicrobia bacterium]|nr:class I SAM-dependent RNA methyltransferase [Elusimicrobiota bacterium]
METLIAVGAPGLESVLTRELTDLGFLKPRLFTAAADAGGRVEFPGTRDALMRAHLLLRTADRVLLRLGSFPVHQPADLEKAAARLPWEAYLAPGRAVRVKLHHKRSRLNHEDNAAERVAKAATARLKAPVAAAKDEAAQTVYLRAEGDACVVELDATGESLSRRGWRLETAKAPLKETLAASLLVASRWEPYATLLDPFCGSGTIAIEAALMAMRLPPNAGRRFAFMDWPSFPGADWPRVKAGARGTPITPLPKILASDRDAGAIEAAKANAARAGVADLIEFAVKPLSAVAAPRGAGWLVTNPPYGVRVSEGQDLRALYAALGNVVRGLGADWTTTMLCADGALARATGLRFDDGLSTLNGGLSVRVLTARPR